MATNGRYSRHCACERSDSSSVSYMAVSMIVSYLYLQQQLSGYFTVAVSFRCRLIAKSHRSRDI